MGLAVYISAAYGRKEEIRGYALQLQKKGHTVTSGWVEEPYDPSVSLSELGDGEKSAIALQDLNDVDRCEAFIFFAEPQDKQPPRGGRHVEFGYALKGMKKIVVIGDRENIFHHLPPQIVAVVPDWAGALAWLLKETQMQKELELWGV